MLTFLLSSRIFSSSIKVFAQHSFLCGFSSPPLLFLVILDNFKTKIPKFLLELLIRHRLPKRYLPIKVFYCLFSFL